MTRPTRPGSIQSAIAQCYRVMGGIENVATDLGISISTLSYGTEAREDRPGGLGVNHLDRLGRVDGRAAEPLARHFAHLAGGVYQPVDLSGALATELHDLMREFADVVQANSLALSDTQTPGEISPVEAARILVELDQLMTATARYYAAVADLAGEKQ